MLLVHPRAEDDASTSNMLRNCKWLTYDTMRCKASETLCIYNARLELSMTCKWCNALWDPSDCKFAWPNTCTCFEQDFWQVLFRAFLQVPNGAFWIKSPYLEQCTSKLHRWYTMLIWCTWSVCSTFKPLTYLKLPSIFVEHMFCWIPKLQQAIGDTCATKVWPASKVLVMKVLWGALYRMHYTSQNMGPNCTWVLSGGTLAIAPSAPCGLGIPQALQTASTSKGHIHGKGKSICFQWMSRLSATCPAKIF